jgi:hypothetical protein
VFRLLLEKAMEIQSSLKRMSMIPLKKMLTREFQSHPLTETEIQSKTLLLLEKRSLPKKELVNQSPIEMALWIQTRVVKVKQKWSVKRKGMETLWEMPRWCKSESPLRTRFPKPKSMDSRPL